MEKQTGVSGDENVAKLAQKINAVAIKLGAMKEDEKNNHQKYWYTSYKEINAKIKSPLASEGLCVLSEVASVEETNNGGMVRSVVTMNFDLVDCETGYRECFRFVGADQDKGGKSLSQAITECQKRFLMKMFFISSKEDDDPDGKTIEQDNPHTGSDQKTVALAAFQTALLKAGHDLHKLEEDCRKHWGKRLNELSVDDMRAIAKKRGVEVNL